MTKTLSTPIQSKHSKLIVSGLFISNWLFIIFLRKHFISPPHGDVIFVAENVGTVLLALLVTGLLYCYLPKRAVVIAIPVTLALAVLTAVF